MATLWAVVAASSWFTPEVNPCGGSPTCSGHGSCTRSGFCACDPGYTSPDCSVRSCPAGCSGRGLCYDGLCFCEPGRTGVPRHSSPSHGSSSPSCLSDRRHPACVHWQASRAQSKRTTARFTVLTRSSPSVASASLVGPAPRASSPSAPRIAMFTGLACQTARAPVSRGSRAERARRRRARRRGLASHAPGLASAWTATATARPVGTVPRVSSGNAITTAGRMGCATTAPVGATKGGEGRPAHTASVSAWGCGRSRCAPATALACPTALVDAPTGGKASAAPPRPRYILGSSMPFAVKVFYP